MCNSCGYTPCTCQTTKPVEPCYAESYNCAPCDPCSDKDICKQKIPAKCTIYNGPTICNTGITPGYSVEELLIRLNNLIVYIDNRIIDCCNPTGVKKPLLPETPLLPPAVPPTAPGATCNEYSYNWYGSLNTPCDPCLEEECKKEVPASCVLYNGSALQNVSQYANVSVEELLATYGSILCGLKATMDGCCPPPTTTTTTSTTTSTTSTTSTTTSTTTAAPTTTTSTTTAAPTTTTSTTTAAPTTTTSTTTAAPTTTTSTTTSAPATTSTTTYILPSQQYILVNNEISGPPDTTINQVLIGADVVSPVGFTVLPNNSMPGDFTINRYDGLQAVGLAVIDADPSATYVIQVIAANPDLGINRTSQNTTTGSVSFTVYASLDLTNTTQITITLSKQ